MGRIWRLPDKIIVKASKWAIGGNLFLVLSLLGMLIYMISILSSGSTKEDIVFFTVRLYIPAMIGILIYVFISVLPMLRKIVMSAEGCTVSLLMFSKTMRWDEFAVIREVTWKEFIKYRGIIRHQGIGFSLDPVNGRSDRKIVKSKRYLSRFYVSYDGIIFNVDKEEIHDCLKHWGVPVQMISK